MGFPNLRRASAIAEVGENFRKINPEISNESIRDSVHSLEGLASRFGMNATDMMMELRFYSDIAPIMDYSVCEFDDQKEAEDFARRVMRDQSIALVVEPRGFKRFGLRSVK